MSCCSHSIDEARHERLKALADSINETARMARATLALLLTAALYLGFTLLSSTDENLLLNAQVAVLQVGFGMALEQSYIFGPPIFLYLHVQGLFLLSILARKVQGFNKALDRELAGIPNSHRMRQEYWNWLSAFAFVQLFREDRLHFVPRLLMWISMEAIPLLLLFAVDLSFVRYQYWEITYSHHAVFILDLGFVMWFNSLMFGRHLRSLWNDLSRWFSSGCRWRRLKKRITSWLAATRISLRKVRTSIKTMTWASLEAVISTLIKSIWTLFRVVVGIFWTWGRLAIAGIMTLLLWSEVQPPSFDVISVEKTALDIENKKDETMREISIREISIREIFEGIMVQRRNRIWRLDDEGEFSPKVKDLIEKGIMDEDKWQSKSLSDFLCKMMQRDEFRWDFLCKMTQRDEIKREEFQQAVWEAVQKKDISVLDIGPCQWWGLACRYLSVKGLWLVSTRPVDVLIPKIDESDEGSSESVQWSSLNELSLAGRNLRFADFRFAKLQGANLEGAKLQGAYLDRANLRDADLSRAKMDGTFLLGAQLQYAKLTKAELRSAYLHRAKLQHASLNEAQLWNANLKEAELQRTDLVEAELQGVNMESAYMDGASLWAATLTCTNLKGARLRGTSFAYAELLGTDLESAQLQGAKLQDAKLLGTNLEKSQLDGVDFHRVKIHKNFGIPESWKLAWLHKAKINKLSKEKFEKSFELSEIESDIPLFWNQEGSNLQGCVENIMEKATNRDWLSKNTLSEGEEFVIFDGKDIRDIRVPEYIKSWAEWTVGFACKNEYTGYSSVKRWKSENPLPGLKKWICPENSGQKQQCDNLDKMKKYILGKLDEAARDDKCPGLRAVPDGGWRISDSDWRKVWKDDD